MKEKVKIARAFEQFKPDILEFFKTFDKVEGKLLQEDRNTIKKVPLRMLQVACKKFKKPNFFKAIIYGLFREGKAKRSYNYASFLLDQDVLTPRPISFYERRNMGLLKESYYLSEYLEYDFTFREIIHQLKMENRILIIKQFTSFAFKLHNNGINFLDLSPGNVLVVRKAPEEYDFYLIDLNRMKFGALTLDERMHNLRRLWLSKRMIQIIAAEYAVLNGNTYEEVHNSLATSSRTFQKSRLIKKMRKKKYGIGF